MNKIFIVFIFIEYLYCVWRVFGYVFILIDHFTVVCLVTWPFDGSEARVDLVLIQTSLLLLCKTSCSDVNKVHLHDKSREVCIKTRSTLASLPSTGQVAEQTTVKWSILSLIRRSEFFTDDDLETRLSVFVQLLVNLKIFAYLHRTS